MYTHYVTTIDFGEIPIRKTHTDGKILQCIQLSDGDNAEIRLDYRTNQPFAVIFDKNWNKK